MPRTPTAAQDRAACAAAEAEMSEREKQRREREKENHAFERAVIHQKIVNLLDPHERQAIIHALRVSAQHFDEDEKVATEAGHPRLAEQFKLQSKQNADILAWLEE